MAAGGMNASTASPNTSGYSGPAPVGGGPSTSAGYVVNNTGTPPPSTIYGGFLRSSGGSPMGSGSKQAGNPQPPPPGSLDGYAQPYLMPDSNPQALDWRYLGTNTPAPAPEWMGRPTGPQAQPSMTPTPPTNPTPAPPQPQMQPAVIPPYGGPQRGPGASFGGDMDFFGRRGGYENLPPDRMPQRDMFGRGRSGFREPPMGGPTWSQQGGVYSYDPNGQQQRGGFNPFGNAPAMPNAAPGRFRQMMQERMQQMRAQPPAAGLGAINPYVGEGPLPGRRT